MIGYRRRLLRLAVRATNLARAQNRHKISPSSTTQRNFTTFIMKCGGWKLACAVCLLFNTWTAFSFSQTLKTVVDFDGTNGAEPYASMVRTADGSLYGTTLQGGVANSGTVFRVAADGTLTTLYSFCKNVRNCRDGAWPRAGLVQASDATFYGVTWEGGLWGWGTLFRITRSGKLTILHSFDFSSGANPKGTLLRARDGNFYGTTSAGGRHGYGTVFKLTAKGEMTVLYNFCSKPYCTDGATPIAGLIQGSDGNFYGTTSQGGIENGNCGAVLTCGTLFKLTPTGELTTLHKFCSQSNCADGDGPQAGLIQATDGDFYGTTVGGGAYIGGTVFKIDATGKLTTLHSFCAPPNCFDGNGPEGGLIQAVDGNFYGTTLEAPQNYGTIFKISSAGVLTVLHSFDWTDGATPWASLLQAPDGTFYGTTVQGGSGEGGTVFQLTVPAE
jgi:uncharacterized repeat protein (TIGR03803 family)